MRRPVPLLLLALVAGSEPSGDEPEEMPPGIDDLDDLSLALASYSRSADLIEEAGELLAQARAMREQA